MIPYAIKEQVIDLEDSSDEAHVVTIEYEENKTIQLTFCFGKLTQLIYGTTDSSSKLKQ